MQYIFDIEDAIAYGLEESVILYNIKYWIMVNKANGVNFYDEHTWTYNSIKAYKELFPFWTEKQIRRILKSLQEQSVIITGNYNKKTYDRTLWYALSDESILPNGQMEVTKQANGSDQTGEPIPNVNTDNKPNRKPNNNKLSEESLFMFETFWALYNKKKNKAGCLKAWAKITSDLYPEILAHVGEYVTATPNKKYRLNPFRYLTEERWTDETDSTDETPNFDYQQRLAENEKLFGENNGKSIC